MPYPSFEMIKYFLNFLHVAQIMMYNKVSLILL